MKEEQAKIEKLWAQYGKKQAEREKLVATIQVRVQEMRNIQDEIAKLEQKK